MIILVFLSSLEDELYPKLFLLSEHNSYCEHKFPCDIIDVRLSDGNPIFVYINAPGRWDENASEGT